MSRQLNHVGEKNKNKMQWTHSWKTNPKCQYR